MKAIRVHDSLDSKGLVYEDAPKPTPSLGEVLIRVQAAGISPAELTWGHLSRPLPIPGHEFSGTVEELGPDVSDVQVGEEIYGFTAFKRDGALAEYTIALPTEIAPKPASLTHQEAAAVPLSALTAWQGLIDHASLTSGQTVLILGAAGGVGSFAVQFAKWRGAPVIGTASTQNKEFLESLGVDQFIDYKISRFEESVHDVDVIFDAVGGETLERSYGTLRKGGVLITIPDTPPPEQATKYGVQAIFFVVRPDRDQLIQIGKLIDSGQVKPIIERVLPLSQAPSLFDPKQKSPRHGKTVLQVSS
jgi:NADPH:quinone reductase-like Zn-dependent oxidoreductase